MSRFGDGIYDSDTSLDFLWKVNQFLMKETVYLFSPEQVDLHSSAKTRWLRDAVTIVEIMNVFAEPYEEHFGLPTFLEDHGAAITSWREAFFHVWDAKWDGVAVQNFPPDPAPYNHYAYRVEHRHTAVALFDRLSDFADYWRGDLPERDLQPFAFLDKLPVFALPAQQEAFVGEFFYAFVEKLTHFIVFTLSDENTERGLRYWDIEKVSVAVDLIGLMCEKYRISPQLRPQTVQRWLDKLIGIWIDIYSKDPENPIDAQTLAEKDGLYTNVVTIFVRLITVAQQYPSWNPL